MAIKDIYKIDNNSEKIQVEEYGQWDAMKGITGFEPNIFKRRSNFHGHQFK